VEAAGRLMAAEGIADWVKQNVSNRRNTATNHNQLWVENGAEACDGLAQPGAQVLNEANRARILFQDGLCNLNAA